METKKTLSEGGRVDETIEHIYFHCRKVHIIWKLSPVRWKGIQDLTHDSEGGGDRFVVLESKKSTKIG